MKVWQQILLVVALVGMTFMMGLMLLKIYNLETQQTALQTQVIKSQQLADGISRAMATYATKQDIQTFADQNNINLKAIQDNLSQLSASLSSINQTTVDSQKQNKTGIPSTGTSPRPATTTTATTTAPAVATADPYGYDKERQTLAVNEVFPTPNATSTGQTTQVPFGTVGFSAWQKDPWDVNIPPREYKATTVIGTDDNNRQYAYNHFSIATGGKEYPVQIKSNVIMQEPPSNKFSFWNPHLFITGGGAANLNSPTIGGDANVGLAMGIMSYGQTTQTPVISVLQLGAGYQMIDKRPTVLVNPVMFNVGRLVSPNNAVISNTYVGPSVQMDVIGGQPVFKAGANISLAL